MKVIGIATAGIAAVAVVATSALAPAAGAPARGTDSKLAVSAISESQEVLDNPPASTEQAPFSAGDVVVFTNKLVRAGKTIGIHRGVCTATDPPKFTCTAVSHLQAGDISIQGVFDAMSTKPQRLSIVGGTGRYRRARGELQSTNLSETRERFVYHIDR